MNRIELNNIEAAIEDIQKGKMVIVVDDEDRENEGDLIMAASKVTADHINFMATHGRGLICAPITAQRARELELPYMVNNINTSSYSTPFTISIDIKEGGHTGISCNDRAKTILSLTDSKTKSHDFTRPGHIFPLIARDNGVLERNGHTEAAVDLAKLAGLYPAGVICEIMNPDGTMSRLPQLKEFANDWNLKIITIKNLISYIKYKQSSTTRLIEQIPFPSKYGKFKLYLFENNGDKDDLTPHMALVSGEMTDKKPALVRVHSECMTGDVFGSLRCDCGDQLDKSLELIGKSESGILIYLRQEGRGIGLPNKIKAYRLQDEGHDTVSANLELGFKADERNFTLAKEILHFLGAKKIKLLTNNPQKLQEIQGGEIEIIERVPLEITPSEENFNYLTTKQKKLGHFLFNKKPHINKNIQEFIQ